MSLTRNNGSSSASISPTRGIHGPQSPADFPSSRSLSTQHIDALADLASMQAHQPQGSPAPMLQSRNSFESQLSPSTMYPTVQTIPSISNPRTSLDFTMADAPRRSIRLDFSDTSLPPEAQQRASLYANNLQQNPYAYESHAGLIKILHEGFVNHVYPPDDPGSHGDPHTFDLLDDLRGQRESMDKLFAIGEDMWVDWIQDESVLSCNIDQHIGVMEKCVKAVQEEYGSTRLWVWYGDWILHCYNSVQEIQQPTRASSLSQEDVVIGREVFTWQLVLDVWKQGANETGWRINDSHLVWDRYIGLLMEDLKRSESREKIAVVKTIFEERLQMPHSNRGGTFQTFSGFVTAYLNADYEEIMASATRSSADAKAQWDLRRTFESAFQKAQEAGDLVNEYTIFVEYVEWERTRVGKPQYSFMLLNSLYERAELRFPSDANIWEDHAMLVADEVCHGRANVSLLGLLERATRHCPWSGSLWSQYLLSSEREGQPFTKTEEIKHKATNTGLLDVGGIDETLKFHVAWCTFLRRNAFRADSSDEDLDVAEVGIRSSIENLQELANKKLGEGSSPDPFFRLEQIYIKYLSDSGSWDSAREVFRGLVPKQGDSWEFWMRFYIWEMMCWAKFIQGEEASNGLSKKATPPPHYATAILKEAVQRPNLDWPEKLMQALVSHCEDHEEVDELQRTIVLAKKLEKTVARRREKEAARQLQGERHQHAELVTKNLHTGKRKRDEHSEPGAEPVKRPKAGQDCSSDTTEKQPERNRENATILVENLPDGITELRVRQFFRDCGTINSIKILRDTGTSAFIEFEDKQAAAYAQTRDGRIVDGNVISVELSGDSTLWVTNFPPTADEEFLRKLFQDYGEIVEIRLPSLKFDTHRRFCYIQFKSRDDAHAATEMDDHILDDGLKLVVKLSDPTRKQKRSGALEEGREVYIKNLDWSANEGDVKAIFARFGAVLSVRIPKKVDGKSKGFGFVVFETPEEAQAALEMHQKPLKNRTLHVEISSRGGAKRQAHAIISRVERSKSPPTGGNGGVGSLTTETVNTVGDRNSRTVAFINVPDTVGLPRVRALAEECGSLVKAVLRADHQGAVIEYIDERDAGKARLKFNGFQILPGRKLRVGTVREMLNEKAEVKTDKIQVGKARAVQEGNRPGGVQGPTLIKRPGQQSRRGGLGQKRDLGFALSVKTDGKAKTNGVNGGKSNDDFRAMLVSKKN